MKYKEEYLPNTLSPQAIANLGVGSLVNILRIDQHSCIEQISGIVVCTQLDKAIEFKNSEDFWLRIHKGLKYEAGVISLDNRLYPCEKRWCVQEQSGHTVYHWGGQKYSIHPVEDTTHG